MDPSQMQSAKDAVRDALAECVPNPEDKILLSTFGDRLRKKGVLVKDLGFPTLKAFLASIPDVCAIVEDPVQPVKVAVRAVGPLDAPAHAVLVDSAEPVEPAVSADPPEPAAAPDAVSAPVVASAQTVTAAPTATSAPDVPPEEPPATAPVDGSEPTLLDALLLFAFVPPSNEKYVGVIEYLMDHEAIAARYPQLATVQAARAYLAAAWKAAVHAKQVAVSGQLVVFDTGLVTEGLANILAVFEPNHFPNRQAWILRRFVRRSDLKAQYGIPQESVPGAEGRSVSTSAPAGDAGPVPPAVRPVAEIVAERMAARALPGLFREFAVHRNFPQVLEQLEGLAMPEPWSHAAEMPPNRSILVNYMIQTYQRLRSENKVLVNPKGDLAVFNTGLVDRRFVRPILACYAVNRDPSPAAPPWTFLDFAIIGETRLGTRIADEFDETPKRACYYAQERELVLLLPEDRPPKLIIQSNHIIGERLYRFPAAYLAARFHQHPRLLELLAAKDFDTLGAEVLETPSVAQSINDNLRVALERSFTRLQWNYRTAIPYYYPRMKRMSFLLPVSLENREQPDVAVVVDRRPNGTIHIHTVLDLEMAYNDARLVNRIEHDWLRT